MNDLDFLNYISNPLGEENIEMLYKANGIVFEKCELFYDFVMSLTDLLNDTYLGEEFINEEEVPHHFDWCWSKTIENFKKEKIVFNYSDELFDYFFSFILETFYSKKDKKHVMNHAYNFWGYIFCLKGSKTKAELDTVIEVYRMFEKSLKKR